ncbi:MAG: LssY C-terminal domain-containing protein [Patescibacteria group bacterium]
MKRRFTPDEAFGLHLTIGIAIILVCIVVFYTTLETIKWQDPFIQYDVAIINLAQVFRGASFNASMLFLTDLGRWEVVAVGLILALLLFLFLRMWHAIVALIISVVGAEFFILLGTLLVKRPRPYLVNTTAIEVGFSFPSSHTLLAVSFYGFLTYLLFRTTQRVWLRATIAILGAAIVGCIGFSRIYLGVHWPSDVIASIALGSAWLATLITSLEVRRRLKRGMMIRPKQSPVLILLYACIGTFFFLLYASYFFRTHPLRTALDPSLDRIELAQHEIIPAFMAQLPRYTEEVTGSSTEPINVVLVGTPEDIHSAFLASGWVASDELTMKNALRSAYATVFQRSYPEAPGITTFWNGRPNDISYEKLVTKRSLKRRHHIHIWETPYSIDGAREVWVGAVHFDERIKLKSRILIPVHAIDPDIDSEREALRQDFRAHGVSASDEEFHMVQPASGKTLVGDEFFTDGKAVIIYLEPNRF